jgi:outer membrane receptor protein involved in Fe transport
MVSLPLRAQVTGATLSGTVTDSSGAVIPNAQITAKNMATGGTREVTADAAGLYSIPNLLPGSYEVRVSAKGFSTAVQSNITLAVGAQQQLNFPMKVGETATTVEVTEAAPQIELTSSTLTGQVESQTVRELPLNGRDWTSLATLQPGVNQIETQMSFDTSARGNRGFGSELTVSGGRPTFNNYRIDGISVNDYANAAPGSVIGATLGVDAVQEFSVLTGGFSAEYGKASGGVVNAITKSGTNAFHGDAYEFLRNSALDARTYFDRTADKPKATFRRNQFGASAGGPIIKDRTFIFGDYEGMRQAKGITGSKKVLSNNARQGILVGQAGANQPAGTPCTDAGGAPGHFLSPLASICVDDAAAAMLAMWPCVPASCTPDPSTASNSANFVFAALNVVPENFYTFRVDHKMGTNDSLFGTYLYDDTDYTTPDSLNNVRLNSHTRRQTVALEWSHTFGPSFVNAARIGYNRSRVINFYGAGAINPAAANKSLGSTLGQTAPRVGFGGGFADEFGGVGASSFYRHYWNSYQYYDDAFWTHGTHTVKFGVGVERMDYNFLVFQNPGGRWRFPSLTAFLTNNQANSFEAGLPNTVSPRELRQTLFGGYVQDDWRFRSNLTLNIGLRYEMTTILKDGQGKIASLLNIAGPDPTPSSSTPDSNLRCGTLYTNTTIVPQPGSACGSVGPYYSNPTLRNFEPRVGFAWDPFRNGKTSVRGGMGIYDVQPLPGYFLLQQNQSAPFMIFKSIKKGQLPGGLKGQFFPQNGQTLLTTNTGSKLSVSTVETNPHRSYVMEWNLNVQRQIGSDLTATIGYVGSRSVHLLLRGDDGNMTIPTATSAGLLFPCGYPAATSGSCTPGFTGGTAAAGLGTTAQINPAIGVIRYIYWGTGSAYDGMNVNIAKRMSHGFQAQVAYTWSKAIDDNSSTIAGDSFGNSLNSLFWFAPKALRGPSDFNVGQSWTINGLWDVPGPKSGVAKAALGGWELGSIFKINTGVPTTAIIDADPMGLQNSGADQFGIPNRVPGCDPVNHNFIGDATPSYFNVNCFTLPTAPASMASQCGAFPGAATPAPSGQVYCANLLGNGGRNSIVGPRLVNMDFSVFKNIPIARISEAFKVQFRAEMFNILNHSNFVPPQPGSGDGGSTIFNDNGSPADTGTIHGRATDPRDIQFALKVIW